MSAGDLEERMENLERIVEPLRGLPDRVAAVELQIVQLRGEMADGFSAVRGEMAAQKNELRDDIASLGREVAGWILASETRITILLEEALGKRRSIDEGDPGR